MTLVLNTRHSSDGKILLNWDNVSFVRVMENEWGGDEYSEVNFCSGRILYVKETLQQIKEIL